MDTLTLFAVKDWDAIYETYESKRLQKACHWVAMPNKHDGRGYRRIVRQKEGAALYGAWALIVQVASKCPVRGVLADADGPLTPLDLEDKTGIPEKTFARTLELTSDVTIGWALRITEPAEIQRILAEITARRTENARRRPQPPARSGHSPAEHDKSPQNSGESANPHIPPQIPADSRKSPQDNAPHGRALAYRTVPDSTGPDTTSGHLGVLEETASLLLQICGKKRRRLGREAEDALARMAEAGDLPLRDPDRRALLAFYALPPDEKDVRLRSRFGDADKLAINLGAAIERACAYLGATEPPPESRKKNAGPSGWTMAFQRLYPKAAQTEWDALDPRVQLAVTEAMQP